MVFERMAELTDANIIFLENQNKLQKEEIHRLQEQLRSIQFENGGHLGATNSPANELGLSSAVFSNHIILTNIFKHLDVPELKVARLVCSSWSDLAISESKFRLNLVKLFPCCTVASVPPLRPSLASAIYFHNHCAGDDEHEEEQSREAAANNFLAFCSQFHESVQDIHLQVDMSFPSPFFEALSSMGFPNLEKIRILQSEGDGELQEEFGPFPDRPMLRRLDFETERPSMEDDPFLEILQKLIQSAPNLEELSISDNFFPDLSTASKLHLLELSPTPFEPTYSDFNYDDDVPEEEDTFSMAAITRMLQQRKDSLKKLILSSQSPHLHEDGHVHSKTGQFKMPDNMPKLEVLINYAVELFPIQNDNQGISPTGYPTLRKLILREQQGRSPKGVEGILQRIYFRNDIFQSVNELDLGDIRDPLALPIVSFPNVERCHIHLPRVVSVGGQDGEVEDTRDKQQVFKELFQTVSKWPLKTFGVQIQFRYTWSMLVDALSHFRPMGNGLETLKIENTDSYGVQDDFQLRWKEAKNYVGKLEDILLQSKGMRRMSFKSFSIKTATAARIIKFIMDNDLPVHFPE